ncbi:MAG: DHH family phosphoesterase [Nanoarchaeota archaeon]
MNITEEYFVKSLEAFSEVLIIDHHLVTQDWNSDKTTFLNIQDYCAAYICYCLFSKIQDLQEFDWLAALASVSDWAYFKNQNFMKSVFKKYGDDFVVDDRGIRKSGKLWDIQWILNLALIYFFKDLKRVYDSISSNFGDIGDLEEYTEKVQEELDFIVRRFEKQKEKIKYGFFYEYKSKFDLGSIVINVISGEHYNDLIITAYLDKEFYKISARKQDGEINLVEYLRKMFHGLDVPTQGGHFKAAGGSIGKEDLEIFKERLKEI